MSLLNIPREPQRKKLKLKILEEDGGEFEEFVDFARQEQPHATKNNVLQYMLEEFFSSSRQDVSAFREWKKSKEIESGDEKSSDKVQAEETGVDKKSMSCDEGEKKKTTASTDSGESTGKEAGGASPREVGKADRQETKAVRKKRKRKTDQTGEMKAPTPKEQQKTRTAKRQIERASSTSE